MVSRSGWHIIISQMIGIILLICINTLYVASALSSHPFLFSFSLIYLWKCYLLKTCHFLYWGTCFFSGLELWGSERVRNMVRRIRQLCYWAVREPQEIWWDNYFPITRVSDSLWMNKIFLLVFGISNLLLVKRFKINLTC